MQIPRVASNPFALMTHPQAVVAAVEASERLRSLRSRVCRPLDKVGFGHPDAREDDAAATAPSWEAGDDPSAEPAVDPAA